MVNYRGEVETYKNVINVSGLNAAKKVFELPRKGQYSKIVVEAVLTVTDAGIAAGETLAGLIDKFRLTDGSYNMIELGRDHIVNVCRLLAGGVEDGSYVDPVPTTATRTYARYTFYGPWDLDDFVGSPRFDIDFRPAADEWGGATDLQLQLTFKLYRLDDNHPDVPSRVIRVIDHPSATRHELRMPDDVDIEAFLITHGGTAVYTDRVDYPTDHGLKEIPEWFQGLNSWQEHINEAPTNTIAARAFEAGFYSRAKPGRIVRMETTNSVSPTTYYVGRL